MPVLGRRTEAAFGAALADNRVQIAELAAELRVPYHYAGRGAAHLDAVQQAVEVDRVCMFAAHVNAVIEGLKAFVGALRAVVDGFQHAGVHLAHDALDHLVLPPCAASCSRPLLQGSAFEGRKAGFDVIVQVYIRESECQQAGGGGSDHQKHAHHGDGPDDIRGDLQFAGGIKEEGNPGRKFLILEP